MALRRGFKTEANTLATEVRGELGLRALDRLDPFALAAHLGIPIGRLSDLLSAAPAANHLLDVEPEAFSAVTVFRGRRRQIIYNDRHAVVRQHSSVAHEAAHGLLLHEPQPAVDHHGCRLWNQDAEDEANWLAGVLLVSEDAALAVARGYWATEAAAAETLGVSDQMLTWRLNMTGAHRRVQRTREMTSGSRHR